MSTVQIINVDRAKAHESANWTIQSLLGIGEISVRAYDTCWFRSIPDSLSSFNDVLSDFLVNAEPHQIYLCSWLLF